MVRLFLTKDDKFVIKSPHKFINSLEQNFIDCTIYFNFSRCWRVIEENHELKIGDVIKIGRVRMKLDRIYLRKKVEDVSKLKQNIRIMENKNLKFKYNDKDEKKDEYKKDIENKTIVNNDNIVTEYNAKISLSER